MKTKSIVFSLGLAAVGVGAGWFAARHWPASTSRSASASTAAGRKILYYQSAMHPWIKSDKPGKCTICGMDLVPVYEGDKGFDASAGLVTLSSNSVNVIHVRTDAVRRGPLRRTLRVAGTIEDDDSRHRILSAYVDGRIDRLQVNYVGAEVVENQPLAEIYSPTLLNAEREYVLLAARKPGPADPPTDQARLLEAARLRLKRMGLTDTQVAALPAKPENAIESEILAPISGTVVARNVYEGQYVREGDKLFELADFSTMWFRFDAYEQDLPWLAVGLEVDVTVPAVPGKVYRARITFIDPNLKDPTRSAKVRVELPNPVVQQAGSSHRELYHRLYAEATVKIDIPEVLTLPRSAVLSPGSQPVVYVDRGGGAYEERQVRLGRAGDAAWELLGGVSEGEQVVTAGNLLIDSQAQLNQASQPAPPPPDTTRTSTSTTTTTTTSATPAPASPAPAAAAPAATAPAERGDALDEQQRNILSGFLARADALRAALSGDNLDGFNREAAKLHDLLPGLLNAFDPAPAWHPLVARIESAAHLEKAASLKDARKEFYDLSAAVVDLVQKLRSRPGPFTSIKVFQCPMLKQAFPGAPARGLWMQLEGPLRNPYFGADMIDCGTELR